MSRVHNIAEIMRRTGLSREALFRLREAGVIDSVDSSPLGRPLFGPRIYSRIERAEQLRELGMAIDEIRQVMADTLEARQSAPSPGGGKEEVMESVNR